MATEIQIDPTSDGDLTTRRNLIVCIDGTSNQFGSSHTNVAKLCEAVNLQSSRKKQLVHYSSGIGTRMKEMVSDVLDMVVAWSIDKNIKEAYGWLAEKYKAGDDIFLFGFSRGAYQVRVLAGMIHEVGLIRTRTEGQIDRAYGYYEDIQSGNPEVRYTARNFKKTFCWGDDLTIHFIGVWDTVSSVGLSRGDVSLPMSSTARFIRHALALDECRVKFMPEYFRETRLNVTDDPLNVERAHSSGGDQDSDIKEVWFAGSHSDVGGLARPGKTHHAGNVSLLWMYREAAEHGLELRLTDVTWGPDDIDFGTKKSMSALWYIPEYISMKQQVPYGRSLKEAQRMHRSKPRLIMPHQKVHASILCANMYRPLATWTRGFDMSVIYGGSDSAQLYGPFWETDLFSDMEAQQLLNSLSQRRLGAPEYLEKLLFMLQFDEGKKYIRRISGWQEKFAEIIDGRDYAPHVRLVAMVAYYEASYDAQQNLQDPVRPRKMPYEWAFKDAKECFCTILKEPRHRYKLTMIALLNSLTRHRDLQQYILTPDVLGIFVELVDLTIAGAAKKTLAPGQREKNFIQVIKGLNALLQCDTIRDVIIRKLQERSQRSDSEVARLCHLLEVKNPHLLVAALRMILTLGRIRDVPEARTTCFLAESRIRELMKKHNGVIGSLAVEIWLVLHGPDVQQRLSVIDAPIRENLVSTLYRTDFDVCSLVGVDSSSNGLASVFGLDAQPLDEQQKKCIQGLTKAAASRKGDRRVRTALKMTLLKLCEIDIVRTYLREIDLVDMFVNQLRGRKDAVLAAFALATCLKYPDMAESIENNVPLPKHIVGMLQLDYFDDVIGQVEGLTIFVYLMRNSRLRRRVIDLAMIEVLGRKAGQGQLKNIVTGLLHMDRSLNTNMHQDNGDADSSFHNCTQELVTASLTSLREHGWKAQKTGVTILTALAQTSDGAEIIKEYIPEIISMILPEKYQYMQAPKVEPRSASDIMGPACALQSLQQFIRGTEEYRILTQIHASQTLIAEKETAGWRVYTPTKSDVTIMLEKMVQAIEEDLSGQDLTRIADTLPPALHRERALMLIGYTAAGTALLPVALGASFLLSPLALTVGLLYGSIYLSVKIKEEFGGKIGRLSSRLRR